MKIKLALSIAVLASVVLTPSCSVFQKPVKVTGDSGKKTTVVSQEQPKKNDTGKQKSKPVNKKATTDIVKHNSDNINAQQHSVASNVLDGEWTLISVMDNKLTGDERPYIYFEEKTGRFYGSNTCNILNGEFKTTPEGGLQFGGVISTMKMCHDTPYEFIINSAIDEVRGYKINNDGGDATLSLLNKDGKPLLVLNRHNLDFLNGAWKVVSIDGVPVTASAMRFSLDIPELKIHGNAGCNILNGSILVDHDRPNSIQFQELATTRMMCPDIQQETALLVALEEVTAAYRLGESRVVLRNNGGKDKIILERINRSELETE